MYSVSAPKYSRRFRNESPGWFTAIVDLVVISLPAGHGDGGTVGDRRHF